MIFDFRKFVKVKSSQGFQLSCHCPFHDDRRPSFSANEDSGLWTCHAGCGTGNYDQFITRFNSEFLKANFSTLGKVKVKNTSPGVKVAEYIYDNDQLEPSQIVERYECRDGTKYFRQMHKLKSGIWDNTAYPGPLAPYLYSKWKDKDEFIFVAEGEKCAEALWKIGCIGTTVAGGAKAWNKSYSKYFKQKDVIIVPDNDDVGEAFAKQVYQSLFSVSKSVKYFYPPHLAESEDIVDWIAQDSKKNTKDKIFELILDQKS